MVAGDYLTVHGNCNRMGRRVLPLADLHRFAVFPYVLIYEKARATVLADVSDRSRSRVGGADRAVEPSLTCVPRREVASILPPGAGLQLEDRQVQGFELTTSVSLARRFA